MIIKFELVNEQNIKIIGIEDGMEKEIGCIFTPSSSGRNILNAIQVCGIENVFDYWGCSRYIKPKGNTKEQILNTLESKKEEYRQMKDIQIMFSFDTEPASWKKRNVEFSRDCLGCFNNPCTCDNKGNHKHLSPYNVKREEDIQNKLEYSKEHIPLKEQKKLMKLVKEK